jgi:selenocysteine-specific elongation factor
MIVGTAGHIDHGKTALVKALTGIDADRLAEEKRRGITIDLGFAYQPLESGETLGFVDVPGHERFVHTMLAGVSGIDLVLLVVAADDGIMPQTREHLQILDLLGLTRGLVALTKSDLVPPERLASVSTEIRALLAPTGLAGSEILPVSSVTGAGIADLASRLRNAARTTSRPRGGRFRLAVDRCFTLTGAGTVVTGTIVSGAVATGDALLVSPSGLEARVRGLHAQNRAAESAQAGQRCALNLAGPRIAKDAIARGDWILDPAAHAPTARIDLRLTLLASETKPLRHGLPVHVHLAAAHVTGRVALLEGTTLAPGETAMAQLALDRPIGALTGDRIVLRDPSAQRTIGGGLVLDPFPPLRGRRTPHRLAQLAAEATDDPESPLAGWLAIEPGPVDLAGFRLRRNLMPDEAAEVEHAVEMVTAGSWGFSPARWRDLRAQLLAVLGDLHAASPDLPGLQRDRLRLALPTRLPLPAFAALCEALIDEASLALDGVRYRLPGHSVRLTAEDESLWMRVAPMLGADHRFSPPRVRDIAHALEIAEPRIRMLMKRLARMGQVVEIAHDHFFLTPVLAELIALADELGQAEGSGAFTAAAFRDRLGIGRKVAIQILEFLDRQNVTQRQEDARRVRADRRHLFGRPRAD